VEDKKTLISEAKKNGFHHHYSGSKPSLFSSATLVDGGLTVISRHPIVVSDEIHFHAATASDALSSKGVIYAKIQFDSGFVHFFNTHLQATYNDDPAPHKFSKIRHQQLSQVRDFVHLKTKEDNHPIVLLGDFNVNGRTNDSDAKDSQEYLNLIEILSQPHFKVRDLLKEHSLWQGHPATVGDIHEMEGTVYPKEVHLTHISDQKIRKRLDYIFVLEKSNAQNAHNFQYSQDSCKVEPLFIDGYHFTQLSDHYGISAVFEY